MMGGPYFFGLYDGAISTETAARVRAVLKPLAVELVAYDDPASGPRGWLQCRNLGHPFDRARETRALEALRAAGLWPIPTIFGRAHG